MKKTEPIKDNESKNPVLKLIVALLGGIALIFLLNPGAGFIFEIPDNLPIIGNLDEGAAMGILIFAIRYLFGDARNPGKIEQMKRAQSDDED
jgi:hypothetical protein